MSLSYLQTCDACRHEFAAGAHAVGRTIACPHCRRPLEVVATVPASDRLIGQVVGGWRLTGRLGAGAFGIVYRATAKDGSGNNAAVKLISDAMAKRGKILERFQREAELGGKVTHPNVVGTRGFGSERGAHWLAMELVDGPNLATLIEEDGPLPWQQALDIALQIARALEAVHALGIVHRDLKPANVLIGSEGTAKLADLGLAKQLEPDDGDDGAGLTLQGVPLGSPAFMPPEQVRSARDATTQADLYSLGATVYYLVSGHLPFDGKNPLDIMGKVLTDEPRPLAELVDACPAGLADAVAWLMAKDIAARPADATVARTMLEQVQTDPDAPLASQTPVASNGLVYQVVIVAVIVLIAAGIILAALYLS